MQARLPKDAPVFTDYECSETQSNRCALFVSPHCCHCACNCFSFALPWLLLLERLPLEGLLARSPLVRFGGGCSYNLSQLKFCQKALALSEHTCIKINADSWLSMLHTVNENGSNIGFIEFVFFPQGA